MDYFDKAYEMDISLFETPEFDMVESKVFNLFYIERFTLENVCLTLGYDKKQVYNAIYRIKKKYEKIL